MRLEKELYGSKNEQMGDRAIFCRFIDWPFMYVILLKLVKREDVYLESMFGSDYLEYKRNAPCILPYGMMK
jgi:protein-S-isoprenylcysteine O-methyltransferase Ste14